LRARGAVGVDIRWAGGKLAEAVLTAKVDGRHTVVCSGSVVTISLKANESARLVLRGTTLTRV
jgi:alpha-L-fucosidase 2